MMPGLRITAAVLVSAAAALTSGPARGGAMDRFVEEVQPILSKYCFDCHADGMKRGNMAFDGFHSLGDLFLEYGLWSKVLHRLRTDTMPPRHKPSPTPEEIRILADWVKWEVFELDPEDLDPGHVTLRRLNRNEYRKTIHDLMGVDYNTLEEFPPDDSGHGFDNIGGALSISPLLMEKYVNAAENVVYRAVPAVSKVPRELEISGSSFRAAKGNINGGRLAFDREAVVSKSFDAKAGGTYQFSVSMRVNGGFDFQSGQCGFAFSVGEDTGFEETLNWETQRIRHFTVEKFLPKGRHDLRFTVTPEETPEENPEENPEEKTKLSLRIDSVHVKGPIEKEHWIAPDNYTRFFHLESPPEAGKARDTYVREVLERFALRAYRRPVEREMLDRLCALAASVDAERGKVFEDGIRQAMVAMLASPRFLFMREFPAAGAEEGPYADVDEYTLAARLSYFLWSTMPDKELFELAGRGELRQDLDAQVKRMLADGKADAFARNFTGQWLQGRDVENVSIDVRAVMGLGRRRRGEERLYFERSLRSAMRGESIEYFKYIVKEDRSVLELIDSNYTFLNEELAGHYGIDGVEGGKMRRVELDEDSPRGGVLTQGALLVVTSNPTRTSPVKRGVFILESMMGSSTPSPPANVPELEDAAAEDLGREPTVRELLEIHRDDALCSSCHARFDPMGMALENFNALGVWREEEEGQPIDASGTLLSGETFSNIIELKSIMKNERREDFLRCITEKLITYALGRGLEYYDIHTIDTIVDALEADEGRFSTLLMGIIRSAPFQKMRRETQGQERLASMRDAANP